MGKTINLWGATYNNVPAVTLPSENNSTATFYDVSGVNATASHVLSPKLFVGANGLEQGSMANNGAISGAISDKDTPVSIPAGYTSGGSVGLSAAEYNKLVANNGANIKSGVTLLGQPGALLDWTTFPLALQVVKSVLHTPETYTKEFMIPAVSIDGKPIKYLQIYASEDPNNFRMTTTGVSRYYIYALTYAPDKTLFVSTTSGASNQMWYAYNFALSRSSSAAALQAYRRSTDDAYSLVNENQLATGGAKIVINSSYENEWFRGGMKYRVIVGG